MKRVKDGWLSDTGHTFIGNDFCVGVHHIAEGCLSDEDVQMAANPHAMVSEWEKENLLTLAMLFRSDGSPDFERELAAARRHFNVYECRGEIPARSIVVGRYSVLPFYGELERDLAANDSRLFTPHRDHRWIANFDWYEVLREFTPQTWREHNFTYAPEGAYVVKGATNSRKYSWNTHMWAASKQDALRVASRLASDSMIGEQGLVYRKYVPLETFEVGLNGLPFTNEWRFFCVNDKIVDAGYYWSSADDDVIHRMKEVPEEATKLVNLIAREACRYVTFYVLDVAKTAAGDWILIEMNDGQMSGLSEIPVERFYANLAARMGEL